MVNNLLIVIIKANGTGTPDVATSGSVRTVGRRQRRKTGDGFINMLTPRRKRTTHGSYNLRQASSHLAATNMSLQVPASGNGLKKYAAFSLYIFLQFRWAANFRMGS